MERLSREGGLHGTGALLPPTGIAPRAAALACERVAPMKILLCSLSLLALLFSGASVAADIQVMISAGFHGAYAELVPQFERSTGHKVTTTRGPSMGDSPEAIPTRLARGETADVVIMDGA